MIVNPDEHPDRLTYLLESSDYSLLVTAQQEIERAGRDYGDERIVLYTSGTTGDSKFYGFSPVKVQHSIDTIICDYKLTSADRYLSIMPLWHTHGLLMYLATTQLGCNTHYITPADLKKPIDFDPTFLSAIPDFLRLFARQNFKNLRFARSASAALPVAVHRFLADALGCPIIEAFGMTETCSHCFTNPLDGIQKVGTIGQPSGIQAKIENDHLWVKGPAVFTDQWIDTGDLATVDHDGYYRILGRSIDRINIRGYKIDPLSIENQLYQRVPNLEQIVVFGKDRITVVYVGDVAPDQIKKELLLINSRCNPKRLLQVDTIPVNSSGKVSRSMLERIYQ
jgi:long-subunit acyl-CoA synthetase (AMP-forming)